MREVPIRTPWALLNEAVPHWAAAQLHRHGGAVETATNDEAEAPLASGAGPAPPTMPLYNGMIRKSMKIR